MTPVTNLQIKYVRCPGLLTERLFPNKHRSFSSPGKQGLVGSRTRVFSYKPGFFQPVCLTGSAYAGNCTVIQETGTGVVNIIDIVY